MGNKKISLKLILIIFAVAGLLFICAGAIMGGSLYSIPSTFKPEGTVADSVNLDAAKISDISAVNLNLRSSTITVKTGRIFDVSGTGNFNCYVKNGTLYAGASDETKYYIKVLGMKFTVPASWVCGYGSYVVTIPSNAKLNDIIINTSDCNIAADAFKAKNVSINMKHGDLNVTSLNADTVTTDVVRGTASISKAVISKSASISCSGKTSIGNDTTNKTSINNLLLSTTYGAINLKGKLTNTSKISSKYGSANLALYGSESNYAITSSNPKKLTVDKASGNDSGDHIGDIDFQCNFGSQKVSFES